MPIQEFSRDAIDVTRWKNGAGYTREIVRCPRESPPDQFDWRVSMAEVTRSGPFSVWPGVDRIIALLDGDGVELASTDEAGGEQIHHRLDRPLEAFSFSGDCAIHATMLGAASTDFNVMTRRAAASADMRVLYASGSVAPSTGGVLFAYRGRWRVSSIDLTSQAAGAVDEYTLEANGGLWWDDEMRQWDAAFQVGSGVDRDAAEHPPALIAVTIWPTRLVR